MRAYAGKTRSPFWPLSEHTAIITFAGRAEEKAEEGATLRGSPLQGPINIATNPSCALGDRKLMVKRCSRIISFVVSVYLDHAHSDLEYYIRISDITNRVLYIQTVCATHGQYQFVMTLSWYNIIVILNLHIISFYSLLLRISCLPKTRVVSCLSLFAVFISALNLKGFIMFMMFNSCLEMF